MFEQYPKSFLTPDQVAYELDVTLATVYNLLRKGEIPASKFGGSWKIPKDELKRKLTGKKTRATKKASTDSKGSVTMDDIINSLVSV